MDQCRVVISEINLYFHTMSDGICHTWCIATNKGIILECKLKAGYIIYILMTSSSSTEGKHSPFTIIINRDDWCKS